MKNLLLCALLEIGCGDAVQDVPEVRVTADIDGQLVGAWLLIQDGAYVLPQPCDGTAPQWCDRWTFGSDGAWARDVQGGHFPGAWSATAGRLLIDADDGTAMVGAYAFEACGRSLQCLRFGAYLFSR